MKCRILTFVASALAILATAFPVCVGGGFGADLNLARMNVTTVGGGVPVAAGPEISDTFSSDNLTDICGTVTVSDGNALGGSNYEGNTAYHTTGLSSDDHYIQAEVRYHNSTNTTAGVLFRYNTTNGTGYTAMPHYSGTNMAVRVRPFASGSWEQDVLGNITFTNLTTDLQDTTLTLKIQIDGTTITAWLEGEQGASTLTATYETGNYVGVIVKKTTANDQWVEEIEADAL